MCLCTEPMTFLATSQTFLGVLVTLLVLCLFYDSRTSKPNTTDDADTEYNGGGNNFLSRIIHDEILLINSRLLRMSQSIKKRIDDMTSTGDLKIISDWMFANSFNAPDGDKQYVQEVFDFQKRANRLQSDILSDQYGTLKRIELSNEQFRASLFTLVYGIVVFCVDELYAFIPEIRDGLNLFVFSLTLLSALYWIGVWTKAMKANPDKNDNHSDNCNAGNPDWFIRKQRKYGASVFGILLLFCILCITAVFVVSGNRILSHNGVSISNNSYAICFLSVSITAIAIIAIWRLSKCSMVGNYSYSHVLGHFCAIMLYSIFASILISRFWGSGQEWWCATGNLRESTVAFVLLNGLILPFALPYAKVMGVYRSGRGKLNKSELNVLKLESDIKEKSYAIYQSITKSSLQASGKGAPEEKQGL